jgi:hypothetical protein
MSTRRTSLIGDVAVDRDTSKATAITERMSVRLAAVTDSEKWD